MSSPVISELADLLFGTGRYERSGAPERVLLVRLAPFLPDGLLMFARQLAESSKSPQVRVRTLVALAPRFPAEDAQAMLSAAIVSATTIEEPQARLRAIKFVARNAIGRAQVAGQVAALQHMGLLDEAAQGWEVAEFAQDLTPELIPQAFEIASRAVRSGVAQGLVALAPRLDEELQRAALNQALDRSPNDYVRSDVLAALAANSEEAASIAIDDALSEPEPGVVRWRVASLVPSLTEEHQDRLLSRVSDLHPMDRRAAALRGLAESAPAGSQLAVKILRLTNKAVDGRTVLGEVYVSLAPSFAKAGNFDFVFDLMASMPSESDRARLLGSVAPLLSEDALIRAQLVAESIGNLRDKAAALAAIAKALPAERRIGAIGMALKAAIAASNSNLGQDAQVMELAPLVPVELLSQGVELAAAMGRDQLDREVLFLVAMAATQIGMARENLFHRALAAARSWPYLEVRATLLVGLASIAWEELDGPRLLWEARAAIRAAIPDDRWRGETIERLALRIPGDRQRHFLGDPSTRPDRSPRGIDGIAGEQLSRLLGSESVPDRNHLIERSVEAMATSSESQQAINPLPYFRIYTDRGPMSELPFSDWLVFWQPGGKGAGGVPPEPPPIESPAAAEEAVSAEVQPTESDQEIDQRGQKLETPLVERVQRVAAGFATPEHPENALPASTALATTKSYYLWVEVGVQPEATSILSGNVELPGGLRAGARVKVCVFTLPGELEVQSQPIGELEIRESGLAEVTRASALPGNLPQTSDLSFSRLFFEIRTPPQSGTARLRLAFYEGATVLQSWEIRTTVSAAGGELGVGVSSVQQYTLRSRLVPSNVERLPATDVSLLIGPGSPTTEAFNLVAGRALQLSLSIDVGHLDGLVKEARAALRRTAWGNPDPWVKGEDFKYKLPPDRKQVVDGIVGLAISGYRLYKDLVMELALNDDQKLELADFLRPSRTFQVALEHSARFVVPVAQIYDHRLDTGLATDKYSLCPEFLNAVARAEPLESSACFGGNCPTSEDVSVVCPSGFWGFRHKLGFPVSVRQNDDAPAELTGRRLQLSVGFATDLALLTSHERALKDLFPGGFVPARSRAEALKLLAQQGSQIVYFYCHGGVEAGKAYIRVGGSSELGITFDNLGDAISWETPRPLVFINGCQTAALEPNAVFNLVDGFIKLANAAGVIGTDITVFEEMAAPFAIGCLSRFIGQPPLPIGEAVRRARLDLLRNGNPLGLAYIPFAMSGLRLVLEA